MAESRVISQVNNVAAMNNTSYIPTDMAAKIQPDNPETRNVISSTFGMVKNHILELMQVSTGFDPNVNFAYNQVMTDPSQRMEYKGRVFYNHPAIGTMKPYDENGDSTKGLFTMHVMA